MADTDVGGMPADPGPGRSGDADGEIDRYRAMLARDPRSLVFAALAEAYRRRNRTEEAIATCRKGLRAHPDFVSGRVALARAYADTGRAALAREELERAILAAPDNLIAHRLLADIYEERGDLDLLEKTLHRILSLDPGDRESRKRLGKIDEQRVALRPDGRATEAEGGIVTRTLAEIYAAQGYFEKAFEIFQKLSRQNPGDPVLHERLADLKEKAIQRMARCPRGKEASRESLAG